jgi:hypothetical protein
LNNLAELIAKIGSAAGLIMFVVLMIKFFVQLGNGSPVRYIYSAFYVSGQTNYMRILFM